MRLREIVKEVERIGALYKKSEDNDAKKTYDQYINLIITNDAEKSQQYNLNDYWERLIR